MDDILKKPIKELDLGRTFEANCKLMGYGTLEEIIETPPKEIIAKEGFNYVWFGELIDFLTSKNLLHLLQPPQGNSRL